MTEVSFSGLRVSVVKPLLVGGGLSRRARAEPGLGPHSHIPDGKLKTRLKQTLGWQKKRTYVVKKRTGSP